MMSFVEKARMIGDCRKWFVPRTKPGVKQFTVIDVDAKIFANFLLHKLIASFEWENASRGWNWRDEVLIPSESSISICPAV